MAILVKITATVQLDKQAPLEWFEGDISLTVATNILKSELPPGVSWVERTAQIIGFSQKTEGQL